MHVAMAGSFVVTVNLPLMEGGKSGVRDIGRRVRGMEGEAQRRRV